MTEHLPDYFPIEDVLAILRDSYRCHEVTRFADFIAIVGAYGASTVLQTQTRGIWGENLAGALAVLRIDFREFLTHLAALRRGDGADATQS